jgi:hypothetical protein
MAYQNATSCGVAWLSVAALEFFKAPGFANPWLTSTVACIMFAVTTGMIYNVFWRSYTPYFTPEISTILASPEALPAPPRARFWLAVAILFTGVCIWLVVFGIIHGKPVWSSWSNLDSNLFLIIVISIIIAVPAKSGKLFDTMLSPRR